MEQRGTRWRGRRVPAPAPVPPVAPAGRDADVMLLGSAYCGSTHLGGLLAANLDATYAGELAHLPRFVDAYRLYHQPVGCLLCESTSAPCPVWTPEAVAEAEAAGPGGCAEVVRRRSGQPVVVEGSKWPEWLRLCLAGRPAGAPPPVAVIVGRSPLRYAVSAHKATDAPTWEVAQWWRDVYADALRTTARLGIPSVVVRNEDVRVDPRRAVASVAALIGRDAPGQLAPAAPTHSLGGNLWVQKGYSEVTYRLQADLDLRHDLDEGIDAGGWAAVAASASTTAIHRPVGREASLAFAQTIFDCPGLVDVAQALGYEVARDLDTWMREGEGGTGAG